MRIEKNLSLEGLAAASGEHHFTWYQKVEKDRLNLKLSDIYHLAEILGVTPGWLLDGDRDDSEFVSRLRGMEPQLDERGKRAVLATAEREVEEAKTATADAITQSLIDAGFDPEAARRAVEAMRRTAVDPGEVAAGA